MVTSKSRRKTKNKKIKTRRRGGSKRVRFEGDPRSILKKSDSTSKSTTPTRTKKYIKPIKWVGRSLQNYLFESVPDTRGASFDPNVLKKLSDPNVKELIKKSATDSNKLEQLTKIINKLSGNNMELQAKLNKLIEEHTRLTNMIEKDKKCDCKLQKEQLDGKDKISDDGVEDTDTTEQPDQSSDKSYESTKKLIEEYTRRIKDIEEKQLELKQKIKNSIEKLRGKISSNKISEEQKNIEIKPIRKLRIEYDKNKKTKEQYEELLNKLEKSIEIIDKAKLIKETTKALKQNNETGKDKLKELQKLKSTSEKEGNIKPKVSFVSEPTELKTDEIKVAGDDVLSAEDYVEGSDPWEKEGGRKPRKPRKTRKTIKKSIKKKRKSRKKTNRKR